MSLHRSISFALKETKKKTSKTKQTENNPKKQKNPTPPKQKQKGKKSPKSTYNKSIQQKCPHVSFPVGRVDE